MEMKRFLILVGLVAFGLLLFALPNIITAIKAYRPCGAIWSNHV